MKKHIDEANEVLLQPKVLNVSFWGYQTSHSVVYLKLNTSMPSAPWGLMLHGCQSIAHLRSLIIPNRLKFTEVNNQYVELVSGSSDFRVVCEGVEVFPYDEEPDVIDLITREVSGDMREAIGYEECGDGCGRYSGFFLRAIIGLSARASFSLRREGYEEDIFVVEGLRRLDTKITGGGEFRIDTMKNKDELHVSIDGSGSLDLVCDRLFCCRCG